MRVRSFLFVLLVPMTSASAVAYEFSPATQKLLAQARQVMERYAGADIGEMQKISLAFSTVMDDLAASIKERDHTAFGENTVDEKVATIAVHRKMYPQRYREIGDEYIFPEEGHGRQANLSPLLLDKHIHEEYRLAWEYYLLAPLPPAAVAELYDFRVGEALGRIGNRLSLLALREAYRLSTLANHYPRRIEERQALLLRSLNYFAGGEALEIMLECLDWSDSQSERLHKGKAVWRAEDYALRLLSDKENYGNGAAWRKAIDQQAPDRLPAKRERLLREASEALKKSGR